MPVSQASEWAQANPGISSRGIFRKRPLSAAQAGSPTCRTLEIELPFENVIMLHTARMWRTNRPVGERQRGWFSAAQFRLFVVANSSPAYSSHRARIAVAHPSQRLLARRGGPIRLLLRFLLTRQGERHDRVHAVDHRGRDQDRRAALFGGLVDDIHGA
jgi:hypothetical protein